MLTGWVDMAKKKLTYRVGPRVIQKWTARSPLKMISSPLKVKNVMAFDCKYVLSK